MFVKKGLLAMPRESTEVSACITDVHVCHSITLLSNARSLGGHTGADSVRNFKLVTCHW